MTASRVGYFMRHNIEPGGIEQGSIFARVQAAVIQRIPLQLADCASLFAAACEHQSGARRGMGLEPREHRTLIVGREVKEAIPGEQPREAPAQGKLAHIHQMRGRMRQVALE